MGLGIIPLLIFTPSIILILSAVLPAVYLLFYVYKKDRLEKESIRFLLKLVLMGIVSTILALVTESLGMNVLPSLVQEGSVKYNLILYFIIVGLSEEGFKYLLLKIKTWQSPEFNCQFDGVVYAVFVSLGFALWENISYVLSYGFATALVRAITAIPGHACFGVFMGAFYGFAKRYELAGAVKEASICRKLALIVPVLLHGAYDYFATSVETSGDFIFLVFIIALFVIAYKLVNKLSNKDQYIQ